VESKAVPSVSATYRKPFGMIFKRAQFEEWSDVGYLEWVL
jgi:hypothetical protein